MKMNSKLLSLGLFVSLLVTVPVLARDSDKKCDCVKKCHIVGSYVGTANIQDEILPIEAQFHEDCTATIIMPIVSGADAPVRIFVGAWKCLGRSCFKFCTINTPPGSTPPGNEASVRLNGEICFNNNCFNPEGTATLRINQAEVPVSIALQRVSCDCK